MTDLSPDARRILAQARAGQPRAPQALRVRVKSQVERTLTAAVSSAPATRSFAKRAWLLPSAGVISGLAVLALMQPSAHTLLPARVQPPAVATEVARPSTPPPALAQVAAAPVTSISAEQQPLAAGTPAQPAPAPEPRTDDLRAEMQLLSRAEAALRSDDPQTALQLLRTHARKFRSGQLQDERAGLRLIAQCMLDRDPGPTLARYLATQSRAVLHARVSDACSRFVR